MRIGVYGGTFNPPHLGHLTWARRALQALELDRVLMMVSATPPHKPQEGMTPADIRLEMVRALVVDDPLLEACDLELHRDGPSFTADTFEELQQMHPDAELLLIIGSDQAVMLPEWEHVDRLLRLGQVAVCTRDGVHPLELDAAQARLPEYAQIRRFHGPLVNVSSTELRAALAKGLPTDAMLPPAVRSVIDQHGLFAG